MKNEKFTERSYFKMAALSALLFFVVVIGVEIIFGLFKDETPSMVLSKYNNKGYLIGKVIGAVVYGIIIAYFYKRKARKIAEKQGK